MTYLYPNQLAAAQKWLPFYREAEAKIGVPWALLAALHYRETNFGASTARVGGVLQFDPPLSGATVRAYGAQYGTPDLSDPERDPRTAILCAAAFVQAKLRAAKVAPLTPASTPAQCGYAAFLYNGTGYGSPQNSPYVSNDPQGGVQMRIRGTVPDLHNPKLRVRIDQPDTRPGVLAVMRELKGRLTAPVTAPPALPAAPVTNPVDVVMVAGPDGLFRPPEGQRFVVPYAAQIAYSNGKWWVRPATPEELQGAK